MTLTTTQRRRLEKAGYAPVQVGKTTVGWVPSAYAESVAGQIEEHREDVARITNAPVRSRGRPPAKRA